MALKILVIDDSQDMRVLMGFMLRPEGFEVFEASDGQVALDFLEGNDRPDLIFLDHIMEEMDGPAFLSELELRYPEILKNVPIIMLTGLDAADVDEKRATEIIAKQAGIEPLMKLVKRYLH